MKHLYKNKFADLIVALALLHAPAEMALAQEGTYAEQRIRSSIVTGVDQTENSTFWQCSKSNGEVNYLLFWENNKGATSRNIFDWKQSGNSIEITSSNETQTISDITTLNASNFTAVSHSGDMLNCTLNGRKTASNVNGPLSDGSNELSEELILRSKLISADGGNNPALWRCTGNSSIDGTPSYFSMTFNDNNTGTYKQDETHWFADERFNIVISHLNTQIVLSGVTFGESSMSFRQNALVAYCVTA